MKALELKKAIRFSLHSIDVEVSGAQAERIAADFDFFTDRPAAKKSSRFQVRLTLEARAPSLEDLPAAAAKSIFPDCVQYEEGNRLYYEYDGAVLVVERKDTHSSGRLLCANPALALELGYLFLQSEIGRYLDRQGLHRLHALGIGLPDGRAALVLLPSGGGKSTLAAEVVKAGGCTLLSDDTPIVDRLGRVYPYPLRLSFRPDADLAPGWKEASVEFARRKHGPKILVPTSALPAGSLPRPEERFKPAFVISGRRHGRRAKPQLRTLPRWKLMAPLLRDLVGGIGVPQVAELLLSGGLKTLPGLAPTAASRLTAASALLARSETLAFDLCRDPVANAHFLLAALKERSHGNR